MTKIETTINTVLQQLKPKLASETWESRRRYFNQMIRLAQKLNITEPCQELYDAFIEDDNGSKERRSVHIRCVKFIDAIAGTGPLMVKASCLMNNLCQPKQKSMNSFLV